MKLLAAVAMCVPIFLAFGTSARSQIQDAANMRLAAKPIQPGDWASYNYSNNGWRLNDHEKQLNRQSVEQLELHWKFPAERDTEVCGVIHATPSVVDGFVYFGTATLPKFYCLAPNGEIAWVYDLSQHRENRQRLLDDSIGHLSPENGVYVSALVTEGGVYFADVAGVMYGLDRVTGRELWTVDSHAKNFPGAHQANTVMGSPMLVHDTVVFGGGAFEHAAGAMRNYECCNGRGFVIAIHQHTGRIVWKYDVGPEPERFDPPYVETDERGEHAFHYGPSTSSVWSPVSFNPESNLVFFGTDVHNSPRKPTDDDPRNYTEHSAAVIAVDATDGTQRWVSQVNPGDVWNYSRPLWDAERKMYKDQSIGDTPKIYTIQVDGQTIPVVGVGCKNGGYYVIDQRDGKILHHTPLYKEPPNDDPHPDPRVLALPSAIGGLQTGCATDGQRVFTNGIDNFPGQKRRQIPTGGRVTAISLDATQEFWRHERPKIPWLGGTAENPRYTNVGDPVVAGISLAGGVAFFNAVSSNLLVCLDTQTGQVLKEIPIGPVLSSPAISNGKVYVGTGNTLFGMMSFPTSKTGQLLVFGLPK
ncbi:MAG: PQQ-binding-like beta-propeller repeat protein [Pirellulaceae bacterium]|nr:PQQ-binding-like beta-propeller repeat protein [Pirellulaceae bacterium]